MIIICPSCNKKFEIDTTLVPNQGRTLQCGSCDHQWFYKKEDKQQFVENPIQTKPKEKNIKNKNIINVNKKKVKITNDDLPVIYKKKTKSSNIIFKIFSYLIVLIISIVAIIIFLDTFKNNLTLFFPDLELILYNLFESIKDIKLFLNDLIK